MCFVIVVASLVVVGSSLCCLAVSASVVLLFLGSSSCGIVLRGDVIEKKQLRQHAHKLVQFLKRVDCSRLQASRICVKTESRRQLAVRADVGLDLI